MEYEPKLWTDYGGLKRAAEIFSSAISATRLALLPHAYWDSGVASAIALPCGNNKTQVPGHRDSETQSSVLCVSL